MAPRFGLEEEEGLESELPGWVPLWILEAVGAMVEYDGIKEYEVAVWV